MFYVIELPRVFRQTGLMNCWFYAAMTIVYQQTGRLLSEADYMQPGQYWRPRPQWGGEQPRPCETCDWLHYGLPPSRIPEFEALFHFVQPSYRPAEWDYLTLEITLRNCGPLWFAGARGQLSHAIVVNGVDSDANTVLFGDPASGELDCVSLSDFNQWKVQTIGLHNPLRYIGGLTVPWSEREVSARR